MWMITLTAKFPVTCSNVYFGLAKIVWKKFDSIRRVTERCVRLLNGEIEPGIVIFNLVSESEFFFFLPSRKRTLLIYSAECIIFINMVINYYLSNKTNTHSRLRLGLCVGIFNWREWSLYVRCHFQSSFYWSQSAGLIEWPHFF